MNKARIWGGLDKNRLAANSLLGHVTRTPLKNQSFSTVNAAALVALPALLSRWLPDGRAQGREYIARNPRRLDRKAGSFSVNLHTGRWADFATGDKGGDVISLAAYLGGIGQFEAMRSLANMLGVGHEQ